MIKQLLTAAILSVSTFTFAQNYSGGDGTIGNPYQIANKTDLKYLSENTSEWTKHFIQTADINFTSADFQSGGLFYNAGAGFSPIGGQNIKFTGSYNGQMHVIDSLKINRPSQDYIGLFGGTNSATLTNIGLTHVNVTGSIYVGTLLGHSEGVLSISMCYAEGTVNGYKDVGGLLGSLNAGDINQCYANVVVTAYSTAGGFAAASLCNVINCYSRGGVNSPYTCGSFMSHVIGSITNCYATGAVNGVSKGFAYFFDDFVLGSTVSNCFWDVETTGQASSAAGTGKTTEQMKTQNTFTGWDFVGETANGTADIWVMSNLNTNNGYPVFSWQPIIPDGPPTVNMSNLPSSLCLGSSINADPSLTGSLPTTAINVNNSITITAPKAIAKNSHAVFVLDGTDQILRYGLDGVLQYTYNTGGSVLNGIGCFTADEQDNVYANKFQDTMHVFDASGAHTKFGIDYYGSALAPFTSMAMLPSSACMVYGVTKGLLLTDNTGFSSTFVYVDLTNTSNQFFAGTAPYHNGTDITSIALDNSMFAEGRVYEVSPSEGKIYYQLTGTNTSQLTVDSLVVDSIFTNGIGYDFIDVDTTNKINGANIISVSSSTTNKLAFLSNYLDESGVVQKRIDTTLTTFVNATQPVGIVSTKIPNGNGNQWWIADKLQNKLLRATYINFQITPALPAGLSFNTITGKIDGFPQQVTAPVTYTIIINSALGNDTTTFTFGVNLANAVSNAIGTNSSTAIQTDGLKINYISTSNCEKIIEIADSIGKGSPGYTAVSQTIFPVISVIATDTMARRVTKINAQNQDSIKANIKISYTYDDIKLYKQSTGNTSLSNDTSLLSNPTRTMQVAVLQMHDSAGKKTPIIHNPITAHWMPVEKNWVVNFPVTKFSEFYLGNPATINSFNCNNTGSQTLTISGSYYLWNYDTLYTSGTYVDTLINKTGCDSITTLNLTLTPTGINEMANLKGVNIYPNPSNGEFMISAPSNTDIEIVNLLGNVVYKEFTTSDKTPINLSNQSSGVYFVKLRNSNNQQSVIRIVKE